MTLIRGGDEAGRDPATELADDILCTLPQELDEPLLILRLDGQDVNKGGDLFRHRYGRVNDFSSKTIALCACTMKTIPAMKTDRWAQKKGLARVDI